MATFSVKTIENTHDLALLQKGRCPWCLKKLTPVFNAKSLHIADKCEPCKDTFKD